MPLNHSKITITRSIFYTNIFLKGDLKLQFGSKGLIMSMIAQHYSANVEASLKSVYLRLFMTVIPSIYSNDNNGIFANNAV